MDHNGPWNEIFRKFCHLENNITSQHSKCTENYAFSVDHNCDCNLPFSHFCSQSVLLYSVSPIYYWCVMSVSQWSELDPFLWLRFVCVFVNWLDLHKRHRSKLDFSLTFFFDFLWNQKSAVKKQKIFFYPAKWSRVPS